MCEREEYKKKMHYGGTVTPHVPHMANPVKVVTPNEVRAQVVAARSPVGHVTPASIAARVYKRR